MSPVFTQTQREHTSLLRFQELKGSFVHIADAEGTVSSLPGTLNFRIKFCHSTGIARSGGGVRASTTSYA